MPEQWAAASNCRNWSTSSTLRREPAATSERDATSSDSVWRVSAASTASGPTSTNRRTPASTSDCTAGANRTASRTCRTQYCGVSSSGPAGSPDTVEHTPVRGARYSTDRATCSYSASIGSINAEWKAWLTVSRVVFTPSSTSWSCSATIASVSPENTVAAGAFTAANETVPAASSSSARSCDTAAASIAPPVGSAPISRPRAATSRHASASDHTSAT